MTVETADVTAFARALKALSEPVRLRMVGVLAEGRESCGLRALQDLTGA